VRECARQSNRAAHICVLAAAKWRFFLCFSHFSFRSSRILLFPPFVSLFRCNVGMKIAHEAHEAIDAAFMQIWSRFRLKVNRDRSRAQ
jgi:hypothetical protein